MLHYETTKGGGSNLEIESSDGSIDVTLEEGRVDLRVHTQYELVTESENGIARAFDKKVLDHSLHNVVPFGEHADETEAVSELTSVDSMYAPQLGQMLDWKDEQGEYHLSRYSYNPDFTLPIASEWSSCVYDDVHDTICVLSFGHGETPRQGGFLCVTRKLRGNWVVTDYGDDRQESHYESWFQLVYGDGKIVAVSGNSSREFAYSTDGGFTWEFGVLPLERYYSRAKFLNGAFYFICPEGYFRSTDLQEFDNFVAKSNLLDLTARDGGIVFYLSGDSNYYYIDESEIGGTLHAISSQNTSIKFLSCDYIGGNKYYISSEFGSYYNDSTWGWRGQYALVDVSYDYTQSAQRDKAMYRFSTEASQGVVYTREGAEDGHVIIFCYGRRWVINSFIKKMDVDITHDGATGSFSDSYGSVTSDYAMHVCIVRNQYLFCIAGGSRVDGNPSTTEADTPFILDVQTMQPTQIQFSPWERLPQLSEENNGIVSVQNGKIVDVVPDEDYLMLDGGTLRANKSDRFTPYTNYKLTRGKGSAVQTLWCESARADIEDGTTKVYSDEDCTTEAGTILAHNYNINNPNDVEIDINGVSVVYIFHDSKTPVSLATTKAIVDALEEVQNMANFGIQTKTETITQNGQTTITADNGKLMSEVTINTEVSGGGGVQPATKVYYKTNGTGSWVQGSVSWSTDHYTCSPNTSQGFLVGLTSDGNEPQADLSNVVAYYQWTSGTTFGIVAVSPFTDGGTHGLSYIQVTL